jgi:hypothetical protein
VCSPCRSISSYGCRSSEHINNHLLREHLKDPPTDEEAESTATMSRQAPQMSVVELQRHAPRIIKERGISQSDKNTIIKAKFEEALIAFIVCLNLSFRTVESYWFVALLVARSTQVSVM